MEKSALAVGSEPGFTACPVQGQRQNSKDRPAAHRLYQRAQELGPKGVDAAQQQAGGQAVRRRGEQTSQQKGRPVPGAEEPRGPAGKQEGHYGLDEQRGDHPQGRGEQIRQPGPHHGGAHGVGGGQQTGRQVDQRVSQVDVAAGGDGDMEQIGGGDRNGSGEQGGQAEQPEFFRFAHRGSLLFLSVPIVRSV